MSRLVTLVLRDAICLFLDLTEESFPYIKGRDSYFLTQDAPDELRDGKTFFCAKKNQLDAQLIP
jgi:hypothetical protein